LWVQGFDRERSFADVGEVKSLPPPLSHFSARYGRITSPSVSSRAMTFLPLLGKEFLFLEWKDLFSSLFRSSPHGNGKRFLAELWSESATRETCLPCCSGFLLSADEVFVCTPDLVRSQRGHSPLFSNATSQRPPLRRFFPQKNA